MMYCFPFGYLMSVSASPALGDDHYTLLSRLYTAPRGCVRGWSGAPSPPPVSPPVSEGCVCWWDDPSSGWCKHAPRGSWLPPSTYGHTRSSSVQSPRARALLLLHPPTTLPLPAWRRPDAIPKALKGLNGCLSHEAKVTSCN